jgi:hypothetical protein
MNRAMGSIDQNNVLSTRRNADLVGDPTVAMALECARRRGANRADPDTVRLCNSHRVVRMQPFDDPAHRPHFRMFSMGTAGRNTGSRSFEIGALSEQLHFYLQPFRNLNQVGFVLEKPLVELTDATLDSAVDSRIAWPSRPMYMAVPSAFSMSMALCCQRIFRN